MKTKELSLETELSVRQIAQLLNQGYASLKASVEPIESSSNPLDSFEGSPDLAVVGMYQGILGGWAVQAYVTDRGPTRTVDLIALGDGGFSRAMNGVAKSVSLGKSADRMNSLGDHLESSGARRIS